MSLFSSKREKRLWFWTLVIVIAIFATLNLTATLVDVLRDRGLFDLTFIIGFCLILVALLTQGLRVRPVGAEIGVMLGISAVYLMAFARMGIPERSHLFEYSIVALFVYEALTERASHGRHVPIPALFAVLVTSLVGVVDEYIQLFLPSRVFDPIDILFNVLVAIMAVTASATLGWARRWRSKDHVG